MSAFTHLEDVVEGIAKKVLGSDELHNALAVIATIREELGHDAPDTVAVDATPAADKDQEIADQAREIADLKAALEAKEAVPAPVTPTPAPVDVPTADTSGFGTPSA